MPLSRNPPAVPKRPPVVPVFDVPKVGLVAVVLLPKIDELPAPPPKGLDVDALFPEPNPPKPPEVEAVVEAPNKPPPPPVDVVPKVGLEPKAPPVLFEDPKAPPAKTRLVNYSRIMLKTTLKDGCDGGGRMTPTGIRTETGRCIPRAE